MYISASITNSLSVFSPTVYAFVGCQIFKYEQRATVFWLLYTFWKCGFDKFVSNYKNF